MAKADLIKQAQDLGLDVKASMKVDELKDAIAAATPVADENIVAEADNIAAKSDVAEIVDTQVKTEDSGTAKVAKAGKRSEKGLKAAEEKAAKIERQKGEVDGEEVDQKPKAPVVPTRSKLERRGKKYQEAAKLIEADKAYSLKAALDLLPKVATAKFDATAELHIKLNVDPKQADQNIRDTFVLPAGTGKSVRVAVFVDSDDVAVAKKAGADLVGSDEFLQQLDKGEINFDVLITKPQLMAKLGKYARLLGPKGLMPNPKSGTVTTDVEKAITEAKAGRVEYRVDEAGIVHVGFGKVSFGSDKLLTNAKSLIASVRGNKPSSIKGAYFISAYLSATMGPSIPLDINEL